MIGPDGLPSVPFVLPDGTVVQIHGDIARDHETIPFQMLGGKGVTAARLHVAPDLFDSKRARVVATAREIFVRLMVGKEPEAIAHPEDRLAQSQTQIGMYADHCFEAAQTFEDVADAYQLREEEP